MKNIVPKALRFMKRVAKKYGTQVTLRWTERDDGNVPDPINGKPSEDGTNKEITIRVTKHEVAPAQSGYRVYQEMDIGDAIFDFITPLVRIATAGDTDLAVGDVTDEYTFNAANRAVGCAVPATAAVVDLNDLENVSITVDGVTWVQKAISGRLAKSWEVHFGGKRLSQSLLFRRAT